MKRILITMSALFVALSMPLAAERIEVEGYLVDKMCSAKVVKGGVEAAKAHTKECAMGCKDSGFGVVTEDGKFYKFDEDGDRMAAETLEFDDRKDNIKVVINGTLEGDTIFVIAVQLG